jgi:hypothetical protein
VFKYTLKKIQELNGEREMDGEEKAKKKKKVKKI